MAEKPTVISLFCGCGGLDLGFELAGFEVAWANDNNKYATETYKANFPQTKVLCGTVKNVKPEDIPLADVLVGGYPCQGFSFGGARRLDDPRNALYMEYGRVLQEKQPKMFLAENVKGLMTMGGGEVVEQMAREFAEKGYRVKYRLYNAKQFGVPQDRERVFLVGIRADLDLKFTFPEPTHDPNRAKPYVTLRDTIWDMQDNPGDWYKGHFTSRFMSRQRRRGWDDVAYCVQASAEQNGLHPSCQPMEKVGKDQWKFAGETVRRLSVEECKVIQSFPREFKLLGPLKAQYRQVGNAVPPLLARALAAEIKFALQGYSQESIASIEPSSHQTRISDFY